MDPIGYMLMIAIFGAIVAFLVCREFVLWYFKVNEVIRLLERIAWSLEQLPAIHDAKVQQAARKLAA